MKALRLILMGIAMIYMSTTQAQILGTTVAYWDFANGIPATFENGSTSGISSWEYRGPNTIPNNTVASIGSCGTGSVPITSMSWANGFVIFDSNYWDDDDDVCGGLGTGQDPAPHTSWITTEPIDLTTSATVVLTFQQAFKHYQSSTRVQISTNGGVDWTDILVNTGSFSPASEWKTVNVTAQAAGQSDVRFKFLFQGTYYWWQLDDIAVYTPNPNDIMVAKPKYTTYNPNAFILFDNMEYDSYPSTMIPAFNFSADAVNIGGNFQNDVKLITKVKSLPALTQVYSSQSTVFDMNPGVTHNFTISTPYTAANTISDYIITYNADQVENDDNESDNLDTLDFSIKPYAYARDEGEMVDVFTPGAIYQSETHEVGNFFEARANGLKFHSIGVALGEGTLPGTPIYGIVYNLNRTQILGITQPYIVNVADINQLGEEKIICLSLNAPITTQNDSLYLVMVGHEYADGGQMRIARSGVPPEFASLVNYPESNGLFYLLKTPMIRMNIFPASSIPGCTNPVAANYNPSATMDDGCCRFEGCTDEAACNFDPIANFDDESCCYQNCVHLSVSAGSAAAQVSWNLYDPSGNLIGNGGANETQFFCLQTGCYVLNMYDSQGTGWNGATFTFADEDGNIFDTGTLNSGSFGALNIPISVIDGCTDPAACNYFTQAVCDDGSCVYPGCIDPLACNYDPIKGCDDGSCVYPGCIDPLACNYDPIKGCDDGSCVYPGCIDPLACNYDPIKGCDDGSCVYPGCIYPTACNYDPIKGCDDGSCVYPGCIYPTACNYDPIKGCDDGSCVYPGCIDPLACNYDPIKGCDDGSCVYPGCIDPLACNYDPIKGCDDGSCVYPGCIYPTACNYDPIKGCDDGSCVYPGCIDPLACNYDPIKGCDDGSCVYPGCIDPLACNYDPIKGCDDGSCVYPGCIDPLACNYDPIKGCDDGSCIYPGCIDPLACNYDSIKGCDDGSCVYPGCTDPNAMNYDPLAGCSVDICEYCLGDLNYDGFINTIDLLIFLAEFGCGSNCGVADLNGNGVVNVGDLLLFAAAFGTNCN